MNRKVITSQVNKYLQVYHFSEDDKSLLKNLKNIYTQEEVNIKLCSEDFLNYLLNESDLDIESKTQLVLEHQELITNPPVRKEVSEGSSINGLDKVLEFYNQHLKVKYYNFQIVFFGKKLPVMAKFEMKNANRYMPRHIEVTYQMSLCRIFNENITHRIFQKNINETKAIYKKIGFYDLMKEFGLYKLEINLNEYEKLLEYTNCLSKQNGVQYLTNQKVIEYNRSFNWYLLSNSDSYSKVIIEMELEVTEDINRHDFNIEQFDYVMPYVRIFSISQKRYFLIHVDDLTPYHYDKDSFSKLIIPNETRSLLASIFHANMNDYYGDFIKSKHGGMVILAQGPTGVGKTSTAEVYAELIEKPLYMVQLDELGTEARTIENNLSIIFKRVQKWNAVLLFDEIDIYLFRRENNLKQAAIVGVFLRLLDYFTGLIFFTTNRSSVLDPAIMSRISLKINYGTLSEETQLEIWESKLDDAKVEIDSLQVLPTLMLNGRQIKNAIRVARVLYGNALKESQVTQLVEKYII